MPLFLADYDAAMKEVYLGPIRDELNSATPVYEYMQDGSEFISGRHAYIPLSVGRNEGIGARSETSGNNTLPTAGQQAYNKATYRVAYVYGRIQISGPTIAASQKTEGAFEEALDREISGLTRDMKHEANRMAWGNGDGILGFLPAGAGVTTIAVTAGTSMRALRPNMKIDIRKYSDGTLADGGDSNTISDVNNSTRVITVTATITTTAANLPAIFREDSRIIEPYGLAAIVSTTNPKAAYATAITWSGNGDGLMGGIDRTTADRDWWKCQNLNNSGTNRPLTLDLLQQAEDEVDINSNGTELDCYFTTYALRRKYANILLPERRFTVGLGGKQQELEGGWKGPSYNGVPIKVDKFAEPNKMFGLGEGTLYMFEMSDWDWMDKDGAVLNRVPNVDAYEATLFKYFTCGTDRPNGCVRIDDLTE